MGILDMVARAEVSSDLKHKEHDCAVDVLGAVGLAAIHDPGMLAIYRVKYLSDLADLPQAKSTFILWARRAMIRRGVNPAGASRLGVQILMAWIGDVCQPCQGRGYPKSEDAPMLSAKPCTRCGGSGKNPIKGHGAEREAILDVIERAEDAIHGIQGRIGAKLGTREA